MSHLGKDAREKMSAGVLLMKLDGYRKGETINAFRRGS